MSSGLSCCEVAIATTSPFNSRRAGGAFDNWLMIELNWIDWLPVVGWPVFMQEKNFNPVSLHTIFFLLKKRELGFTRLDSRTQRVAFWKTPNMPPSGEYTLHTWREWRRCERFPCGKSFSGPHAHTEENNKAIHSLVQIMSWSMPEKFWQKKKKFSQQLVAAASCLNHTSFGGLDQPGGSHVKGRSWLLLHPNVYKEGVNCIIYKDTESYFELIRPQKDRPAVLL